MAFDRFNDKPPRRNFGDRFNDRNDREGGRETERGPRRFGDGPHENRFGRPYQGDRRGGERSFGRTPDRGFDRFSDRPERAPRFSNEDRFDGQERTGYRSERGGRDFGGGRGHFGKPGFKRFGGKGAFFDSVTRSGPRAKAYDTRRHADHTAFVNGALVRLDSDVARFFKSADDVNRVLRQVIALRALVKTPEEAEENADAKESVQAQADVEENAENQASQDAADDDLFEDVSSDAEDQEEAQSEADAPQNKL